MVEKSPQAMPRAERDALVLEFLPMVKRVAYRIAARVPGRVDVEDLVSAGCVGLLAATDRFDPSRGKPFEAFAEWRVKGAILDELRGHDHMTRTQRHQANKVLKAKRRLEQEAGGEVELEAIAAETELPIDTVEEVLGKASGPGFVSLADLGMERDAVEEVMRGQRGGAGPPDPYQGTYLADLKRRLIEALGDLPERERMVLTLYYAENLTYKEIAAVLERTESRVCQIHKMGIEALQVKLGEVPEGKKPRRRRRSSRRR